MSSELAVGVVLSARPWRGELQRYVRDHVVGVSVRVVRDPRVAVEEALDVMVVDDEASFLTPAWLGALRARGTRVLGVYDPDEPDDAGRTHLQRLGVDATAPAGADPDQLVAALRALGPDESLDRDFADLVADLDLDEPAGAGGRVVAVGGPPGAGATEVAVALSAIAARHGSAVVVDVDEVNPGVARRLGLGLHPNLLDALDAVAAPGAPDVADALAEPALPAAANLGFDAVVGLANRDDWGLVGPSDLVALLQLLRERWATVVVNLGPHLEDLSRYVDRFGASRAALGEADAVVAVCEASPRGLLRFLDWLADAAALAPRRPVHCLLNRAPRSPFARGEVVERLCADGGPWLADVEVAPEDRRVARAAWDGVVCLHGPFARAVGRLADRVLAPGPAAVRRAS